MARDINGRVAEYRGLVESLARKYVGREGAEFDDLVQEGLINVWQTLERGVTPAAHIIEKRMLSWVELLAGQNGKRGNPAGYDVLLPIDDFSHLTYDPVPTAGHDQLA